jgi:hypothetical protein
MAEWNIIFLIAFAVVFLLGVLWLSFRMRQMWLDGGQSIENMEVSLRTLLRRGYHGGYLMIQKRRLQLFVQVRKYTRDNGVVGIELAFPNAVWSQKYFKELERYCSDCSIPYTKILENPSSVSEMEFLYVDFGEDVRFATEVILHILVNIFQLPKDSTLSIVLHNSSPRDDSVNSIVSTRANGANT